MTRITTFEVRQDNLAETRLTTRTATVEPGQALLRIERFALTANNVTYGVVGHRIGYWKFFPTGAEGWGVIPVWGVAEVVESRSAEVPVGERLYGYWPMADHLVIEPARVSAEGLFDGAAHRSELPPVYNRYARLAADPAYDRAMDDARMVLWPLYATSYCLYDFLLDNGWYGAGQIVIPSASSKTAIGLAYALADDPAAPAAIGVTSARNRDMVQGLGLYDQVVTYEEISNEIEDKPTVIVDMSGSGNVLGQLHRHLGENMKFTSNVGVTHYDEAGMGPDFIRERSGMFFAPGHIQKRAKDWGKGEFDRRAAAFWAQAARRSSDWLTIRREDGGARVADAWHEVLTGATPPDQSWAVSLS